MTDYFILQWLGKIKAYVDGFDGGVMLPLCADYEAKLVELELNGGWLINGIHQKQKAI